MLPPKLNIALPIAFLLFCNFLPYSSSSAILPPSASTIVDVDHSGSEYLDSQQKYLLSWNISNEQATIYFEVTAETTGFVGFGISPKGGMTGADMLIAGVLSNGSTYSGDYHGVGNTRPVEDDHGDWMVTDATENATHTTLRFHRLLNTCDNDDFEITDATMRIIWALGSATDDIRYHNSNRGTKSVNFFLQDEHDFDPSKFQTLDMLVTQEMLPQHTSYWCTIHSAPVFSEKQHIVAFDAVLDNQPALQHTHHFIMYRCVAPPDQDPDALFSEWVSHPGDHCVGPANSSFPFAQYCSRYVLYIWSKGGKRLVFPPDMGLPMPETLNRREYYALEIHYDNPQELEGVNFQTGARVFYTPEVRDTEVGLLLMDHNVVPQLTVPPMATDYVVNGHCSGECTERFLPEGGITIFNNLFHAHLAGRKLKLRHFRGEEELPWVDNDEYYDFDFQQNKPLGRPRKVERGDQLTVECTYDSTTAEGGRAVVGGLSTYEEMCEAIVYYWPRQDLFFCGSEQDIEEHMGLLGVTKYEWVNASTPGGLPEVEIMEPASLAGGYRESVSFKVDWTPEFRERFQQEKRYGEHQGSCTDGTESHVSAVRYPENVRVYVPPNVCEREGEGGSTEGDVGSTPQDGEGTTPEDGEGTTPQDGEGTTPQDGEGTTPQDGEGTTPQDGEGTTPQDGEGTTDSNEGTTPEEGEGTTDGGTTQSGGGGGGDTGGAKGISGTGLYALSIIAAIIISFNYLPN